jgi:hypothetical protein
VSIRHAGNLDMADVRQIAAQLRLEIAFDDLRVIQVHLHFQIGAADLLRIA